MRTALTMLCVLFGACVLNTKVSCNSSESLSEQEDTANTNLAYTKPSFQYNNFSPRTPASKANDGNPDGTMWNSCQHTGNVQNAWWAVDLGVSTTVGEVRIVNRGDCCSERLSNFDVVVSDTGPPASGRLPNISALRETGQCFYRGVQMPVSGKTSLVCHTAKTGRYVYVILRGKNFLHMCEVEVFRTPSCHGPNPHSALNQAYQRPSFQYNDYDPRTPASKANDGNSDGVFWNSCQSTGNVRNAWWAVDLGRPYTVSEVRIVNRGDCCPERLADFDIVVSDIRPLASGRLNNVAQLKQTGECFYQSSPLPKTGKTSLPCHTPKIGRYVYIILRGTNHLTMCEVEVYE